MGTSGCGNDGLLISTDFSAPIPWIGIYVAGASLVCAIAMAYDFIYGLSSRKFWFPTKLFSYNATTLTIITVAVKLSVDLNTPMPSRIDQLAKLSSGVLICVMMGNSMPSLGLMEKKDLMMNLIALVILVITVIVNIGIQLGTGVIYQYWLEHAAVLFLMFLILSVICLSALTVPLTKNHFELKYKRKCDMVVKEVLDDSSKSGDDVFRESLAKLWMMAHTCSPQFVVARSVTCAASGALCLLCALILGEAILRSYLTPRSFTFCSGNSDYKESSILILFTQSIAIAIGTIGPSIRWFTVVNYRCPHLWKKCNRSYLKMESYWTVTLKEMKDCPLAIRMPQRHLRKVCFNVRNLLLNFCIGMQTVNVWFCKAVQLISLFVVGQFVLQVRRIQFMNKKEIINSGSDSQKILAMDLRQFVLHLEGEDDLVDLIMKNNRDATVHWIRKGREAASKELEELVEKSNLSQGFKGGIQFDDALVSSLEYSESPNCWSLPIVNLAAIAIALPNLDKIKWQQLISTLHEGLACIKVVEDNFHGGEKMTNFYIASQIVWVGIDLHQRWLHMDLLKLSNQSEEPREVLVALATAAQSMFMELKGTLKKCNVSEDPSTWNVKMVAANSMHGITKNLLLAYDKYRHAGDQLFDAIEVMISDILCACFISFKCAIYLRCLNCSSAKREDCIRDSVLLLGKMDKILKFLENRTPHQQNAHLSSLDKWRKLYKHDSSNASEPEETTNSSPHNV